MEPKALILAFDLGNVLFGFDYNIALKKIENRINVSTDFLLDELKNNRFGLSFEKGTISPEEFHRNFSATFQSSLDFPEFSAVWCDIFYPKRDVIDLVGRLRNAYPCYLISNINELHFTFLYQRYPDVFAMFDDLILSYQIKAIKPEFTIYQELKKKSATEFGNIIYIDDRKDLVEAALVFGLQCIQFKDYQQLQQELSARGVVCA